MGGLIGIGQQQQNSAIQGIDAAATLDSQRTNASNQLAAQHKQSAAGMAGTGGYIGYYAAPKIASALGGLTAPATSAATSLGTSGVAGAGTVSAVAAPATAIGTEAAGAGTVLAADSAATAAAGTTAAVTAGTEAVAGGTGALAGAEGGMALGPIGIVAGAALGFIVGELM